MKRIKWLVIFALIACCLLFLCSTTHAYSDEEYNYISEMTTNSDNISAAVKEFADMITGITAQKLNDPNYVAKVVVAVATLDGIALQAKDIECPNSFKGSNLYYLQAMDYLHEFCGLFVHALLARDAQEMNQAFDVLPKATDYMKKSLGMLMEEKKAIEDGI